MNKEKDKFNEEGIVNTPQYKKIWYSITKFEKYPEMAAEGVGRAFGYFSLIIFLFSVILAFGLAIKFSNILKNGIEYLDKNFSTIEYKNGELQINPTKYEVNGRSGNLIIDTNELTDEQIQKYEENINSNRINIIWLNNRAIVKNDSANISIEYKDILEKYEITEFNKQELVSFLTRITKDPRAYTLYGIIMIIYLFLTYFLSTLLDIILLSAFGMLTTAIAGIKIRYRAVFNMSVYAFTLSILLQLIYININMFTNFEIKYFDLMYTTIAFICLAAAIFMIKSDVIKQQIQLMRIIEIDKQEKDIEEEIPEDTEKDKDKEDEEQKEKEEKREKQEGLDGSTQGEV